MKNWTADQLVFTAFVCLTTGFVVYSQMRYKAAVLEEQWATERLELITKYNKLLYGG